MAERLTTLVILSPAFAESEGDSWLPAQESFVRTVNRLYPTLKITIITFHFPAEKREYTWYGNDIIALGGGMKGKWNSLLLWQKAWSALGQLRKQQDILGVFSFFCSECAFVGHYFAKRHKLKHHIWILGQDAKAQNKQVKRIKPLAGELVAISDFLVREFAHNHKIRPAHMIPLGLDINEFGTQQKPRTIDLLGVGSLIPLKQYDIFIEVVKRITASFPHVQAQICGDGPEQENLSHQIKALELEQQLTLPGKLPREEVLSIMQQSKILLHTSSYEGFGMVCAEALYAGARVISFCKPLDQDFPGWYIVKNKEEMIAKTLDLLQEQHPVHQPVLTYSMEETARAIIGLFGYG